MIEKCNGSFVELSQFADLVVVSDEAGRMFKNKYCAFCHGVSQFTSWRMKLVVCVEDISTLQLTLSQAHYYMLNKCVMTSERPRDVHVSPRMLPCPMNMVCPDTDLELAEGCTNGPYMPYSDMDGHGIVHKNVLCYKYCSGEQENTECQKLDDYKPKVTIASYQVLLNLRQVEDQPLQSVSIECGEAEVLDKHTGSCRRLYCPPFDAVAYGHCVHMSTEITNLKLSINIIYTMANTSLHPIINLESYNKTVREYYLKRMEKRNGFPKCLIHEVSASIFTDKVIGRFKCLVVNIIYEINQECTIEYIAERIRHSGKSVNTEARLIHGVFLKMDGRISFYNPPVNRMGNDHHFHMLFTKSGNALRIMPLEHFFLCPYFKLSFDEYSQHLKRRGQYDVGVDKPSPLSIYEDGFYPASENEIIVCVDTYQTGSGSHTARAYLLFVIISVSAFVLLN